MKFRYRKKGAKMNSLLSVLLVAATVVLLFSAEGVVTCAEAASRASVGNVRRTASLSNPRTEKDSASVSGQKTVWDCVWFGSYPQAEVITSAMRGNYTALEENLLSEGDLVVSDAVYEKLEEASGWDSNNDITLDGVKYRRVQQKDAVYAKDEKFYYRWNGSTAYHYFRYEPLKWRVLSVEEDRALLVADKVLDDKPVVGEKLPWAEGTIRNWLNGYGPSGSQQGQDYRDRNFLDSAFLPSEQSAIRVEEDSVSGDVGAGDKVFLLFQEDVCSTLQAQTHGFAEASSLADPARQSKSTVYAKAMGVSSSVSSGSEGSCTWALRWQGSNLGYPLCVKSDGGVSQGGQIISADILGVRPALYLNISAADQYVYAGTVDSGGTVKKSVESCIFGPMVTASPSYYTGFPHTFSFTLFDEDGDLEEGRDYEVVYADHIQAGTATLTVIGIGDYVGTKIYTFTIEKREQILQPSISVREISAGESVQIAAEAYVENDRNAAAIGRPLTEKIEVQGALSYRSEDPAVAVVDSNGVVTGLSPGTVEITVSADGNENYHPASAALTVTVTVQALSEEMVSVADAVYTGSPLRPAVTVRGKNAVLVENRDYTLSFARNTDAGTGTVTVVGKGGFTGSVSRAFTIKKADQVVKAHLSASRVETGQTAQITASGIGTLSYSTDHAAVATVDAGGVVTGVSPGTAVITVSASGNGNYHPGRAALTIQVTAKDQGTDTGQNPEGTGGSQEPEGDDDQRPGVPPGSVVNRTQTITASSKTVAYKSKPFSLKAKASGGGKLTYKSSNKKVAAVSGSGKVTVKGYGQATITIRAAAIGDYRAAEKKITVKVVPKTPKLKKAGSPGKKMISSSWGKDKTADGYQMYLCLKKDFKKGVYERTYKKSVGSMKLTGLRSRKTYYIKLRTYKKVGKKKYYSGWSGVKKVKVK